MRIQLRRPCWLIGHKLNYENYGYEFCESCGHGWYYAYDEGDNPYLHGLIPALLYPIIILFENISRWARVNFGRCIDCGKFERLFGYDVGDHEDCVPF